MYGDIYVITGNGREIPEALYEARDYLLRLSYLEKDEDKIGREFKRHRICSTHLVHLEHRNWEFFCPVCEALMED